MSPLTLPDSVELGAPYGTEPRVESRPGFGEPTVDSGDVDPGEGWWFTIEALFCRVFPDLSQWLSDVLSGEDLGNPPDE